MINRFKVYRLICTVKFKSIFYHIDINPYPANVENMVKLKQYRYKPGVSCKLRFPDFLTTAQDGGKFVSLTHRPH
jgi:hypothetical protein